MKAEALETSGGRLSAWRAGGTPLYVLVHGLAGAKAHFAAAFDYPAAGKGRLAVDLLGFGESGRLGDGESYTFERQAAALGAALRALGAGDVRLVLHSMAAALLPAIVADAAWPRVAEVFLLEGNLVAEDAGWSRQVAAMSDAEYDAYVARLRANAPLVLRRNLRRTHPKERIGEWAAGYGQADKRALRETAAELAAVSASGAVLEALAAFGGRKTYLAGEDARHHPARGRMADLGVEIVDVAGAGHYLMLDNPEDVYRAIFR